MDPYKVLNVSSNCSDEQLKEAYRNLLRIYTEQLDGNGDEDAREKISELNAAYDAIMNQRRGGGRSSSFSDIRRLINQNRVSDADELLEGVLPQNRDAEWYFLKGSVYHSRGWLDQARNCFAQACNLNPHNAEYKAAYNNMMFQQQNGYNQSGGYRTVNQAGGCSGCDMCSGLLCADCCCECMGGDLIACC